MAMKLYERYPGRFSPATSAYPQGAFKNRSAPGAKDGSYLEKDWANDKEGFFGSLLRAAGMTPNGDPDTALSSQYFDAMKSLGLQQATESQFGVSKLSTLILALAGADDSTSMTPAKVRAALVALFPKREFLDNDFVRLPDVPGGLIIQWAEGVNSTMPAGGLTTQFISLPTICPNASLKSFITNKYVSGVTTTADESPTGSTTSQVSVTMHNPVPTGVGTGRPVVLNIGF